MWVYARVRPIVGNCAVHAATIFTYIYTTSRSLIDIISRTVYQLVDDLLCTHQPVKLVTTMQNSPVTQTIANAHGNGILAGYLRACKINEEPSGTVSTILWVLLRHCSNHYKANLEVHRDDEVFAVFRDEEVFIGRDADNWYLTSLECFCDTNFCSQVVVQDPTVSNKHCRVYTIVYDDQIEPLIYIEDLSSNGTYWNGSLLGRGNEAALLSNGDRIRISARISYTFQALRTLKSEPVDDIQEAEKRVSLTLQTLTRFGLRRTSSWAIFIESQNENLVPELTAMSTLQSVLHSNSSWRAR